MSLKVPAPAATVTTPTSPPEASYVTVGGFQIDPLGAALLFVELYTILACIDESVLFSQFFKGL